MEFTDFMWIKLILFGVGAFVYGVWLGITGR